MTTWTLFDKWCNDLTKTSRDEEKKVYGHEIKLYYPRWCVFFVFSTNTSYDNGNDYFTGPHARPSWLMRKPDLPRFISWWELRCLDVCHASWLTLDVVCGLSILLRPLLRLLPFPSHSSSPSTCQWIFGWGKHCQTKRGIFTDFRLFIPIFHFTR